MPFSNDQRFLISGDRKENLKEALRCALTLDEKLINKRNNTPTKIGSFYVHEKYGLVFGNNYSEDKKEYFSKYPIPVTLDKAVEHAIQYLASEQATKLRNTQKQPFASNARIHEGWEIYIPNWAQSRTIVAIRPAWVYYMKHQ